MARPDGGSSATSRHGDTQSQRSAKRHFFRSQVSEADSATSHVGVALLSDVRSDACYGISWAKLSECGPKWRHKGAKRRTLRNQLMRSCPSFVPRGDQDVVRSDAQSKAARGAVCDSPRGQRETLGLT